MKVAIAIVMLLTQSIPALANSYTADCLYKVSVAANMSPASVGIVTDIKRNDKFELHFSFEDQIKTQGFMRGNQGVSPVTVVWGTNKITFLEITGNGTVQLTAVYGKSVGKFASVHSRATGGTGYEMPSQYYGTCELKAVKGIPLRKKK